MADNFTLSPDALKALQDQLAQKYQQASDPSGVDEAMQNRSTGDLMANIGQAAETAARAQSMSRGGPGVNSAFWTGLKSQNQQSVQDAITQRQQAIQSAAEQGALQNQSLQQGLAQQGAQQGAESHDQSLALGKQQLESQGLGIQKQQNELKSQGMTLKTMGDEQDATSQASKMAQSILDKMEPGKDHSGITAAQFKSLSPGYNDIYNKNMELQSELQKFSLQQNQHKSDKQQEAAQNVRQQLESARGNPAAAQAERDIYSAQKANSLMNMYGDPNKLSMPQVRLLASEVGKIASGGAPSMHELEGLTPNTLTGKFSEIVSKLTNEPTPANAAAFVKQYKDYADALTKDAANVIQDKYGRVIDSAKTHISDEDYNLFKTNYLDRFKSAVPTTASKPSWAE